MFGKLRRLVIFLVIADAVATQIALFLANQARLYLPLGRSLESANTFLNPALHLLVAVVWGTVFLTLSVYDVRPERWPVGSARTLLAAVLVSTFVFAGVLYFSFRDTPRLLVGYLLVFDLAFLAGLRLFVGAYVRRRREQGSPLSRIIIVGTGDAAVAVGRALLRRGGGVEVVGWADSNSIASKGPLELPILGSPAEVPDLIAQYGIDEVLLRIARRGISAC